VSLPYSTPDIPLKVSSNFKILLHKKEHFFELPDIGPFA
jgi:hypothetical protein